MALVRSLRVGLLLPLLFGALCACGGDDDDVEGMPAEGSGPDGCYLEAERRCDCELDEAACSEDGMIWTDGCTSCAT